jgi:hypothetical protein
MAEPKYTEKNLYGDTGHPQAWDVAQLHLGDCYLLAPMASLAYQQPERIEKAIRYDAPAASFTVTLYKSQKTFLGLSSKPKPVDVTVSQADIDQEGALLEDRPVILTTRAVEGAPNDGLVTSDAGGGHAYAIENISKDQSGNVTIRARNSWGHNMDPPHGVSSQSPTVDVDLKTILENRHLQQIDFGPKPIRRMDAEEASQNRDARDDPYASISTGDPYMDRLLKSLGNERTLSDSLSELATSPHGRDFRTEGNMQYEEMLHQQALEESMRAQQQQHQQQQQATQVGPVLSLAPSE